jgi:hypothetical protein
MKKIVTMVLFSLVSTGLYSQQTSADAEVISASDTLLKTQNDPKGWQTFQEIARSDSYAPDIRSRVMFLFAVKNLLQMNTNLFASAAQKMQTRYPKEGTALAGRLTPADWLVPCPNCGGTGMRQVPVSTAQGGTSRCLNCVGTGKIVQLSPLVKEQVNIVLNEIKALATENIQFAAASKKALAEYNPQQRITALKDVVNKYAHRIDLDEVKQALAKTEAELAKKEADTQKREAEQALREQEERDYQSICSSLENLPNSGIAVMTREIDRFIEKYPKSLNRIELEITKSKLERRNKVHAYMWMGFYVLAGLAAVSLCLSFIRGLFTGKKKETGTLVVPGLTQANEESDPLAGTFTDSDQPLNK